MAGADRPRWRGKLTSLGWLLLAHGDALEADFQQHYGVELSRCTVRRVWVLANALPPGSRVLRHIDEAASWGDTEHLLASLIDAVQWVTWTVAAVNTKHPPKTPTPVRRPGQKPRQEAATGAAALRSMLGG